MDCTSTKVRTVLVAFLAVIAMTGRAQITSTFDTDADGWTCSDNGMLTNLTVNHNASGGNPGGFVSAGTTSSQPFFWVSPAQFGGNISYFSYGQELSFDMQLSYAGTLHGSSGLGDVQIRIPSGQVLSINLPTFPAQAPAWSTHTIRLDETAGWRVGGMSGALATQADMLRFLSGVHSFRIAIKYTSSSTFSGAIDNVVLNRRTITPSPVISSFSPTSGKPGTSITLNGTGFDPVASNNAVYFVGVAAQVTNASATSITVTVPVGARYGPITIINKSTGLAKLSATPFVPLFDDGGRIIRASLDPKFDIPLVGNYGGMAIADMDNDGWNDLVVAREDNAGIWIYRNLGTGGDLTAASFAAPVEFATLLSGTNGSGLQAIDFDNDGKLDMVTSGWTGGPGAFATFRNTSTPGNLTFEPVEHWLGRSDESPVYRTADIDGDGLPELIAGEGSGGAGQNVWITQNMSTPGNIIFGYSLLYFSATFDDAPSGATLADLDGDAKPEFILIHNFGGTIRVFQNTSSPGTISFGSNFSITEGVQGGVNVADFNLDGKMDLAWKNGFSNDDIHIRLNTNSGAPLADTDFATEIILNGDVTTYGAMSIGDINGDGKPDILATDNGDLGIFENVYDGGVFDASAYVPAYEFQGTGTSTYPSGAVTGDMNGDGKPEVVIGISNTTPNRLSIFENKNVHTPVISVQTVSPLKGAIGSTVTITGDYFSTTPSENTVRFGGVIANVLTATRTTLTVEVPAGANYAPVSVTRDGLTALYDLPFNTTFSPGTTFDNNSFAPPAVFTLTTADYDIDVGDLDGDGKPDVVAEGNTVDGYAWRNVHTSGAITSASLVADDTTSSSAGNLKLVDLNDDGKLDIASNNGIYRNVSTPGNINFDNLTGVANGGGNVSWNDFNRDGKMDVAAAATTSFLHISENTTVPGPFTTGAFGSFDAEVAFAKPAANGGTVSADFDRDGLPDVAASNPTTDNITVYRNTGAYRMISTMLTPTTYASLDNPGRIYAGDLDVDGKVDLLIYHGTGANSQTLAVYHNQSTPGNINFVRVDYNVGVNATLAWISDLDGDGKPEILANSDVTGTANDQFLILKNTSTPGTLDASSFAAPFSTLVNNPRGLTAGDLNLDGKPEIILTSAPNSLLVYENLISSGPVITITTAPVSTSVCEGAIAMLTTEASGTTNLTYRWQRFDGTVFNDLADGGGYSGTTTQTLSVNTTGGFGAGDYRCRVSGDLALDVFTETATISVVPIPAAPTVTGDSDCNPGSLTLTAAGTTNGNYRWYDVATGGTAIAGAVNSIYNTPVISVTTTYWSSIVNGSCESTRTAGVATIAPFAKPVISSSEPISGTIVNLCDGESTTLSAPNGFVVYNWSNGATTREITVGTSEVLTVIVGDGIDCISPASDPLTVSVNPYPLAGITVDNNVLTASTGDSYQWFVNDVPESGAIAQTFEYSVLEFGVYAVDVTENGCTTRSDDFVYLITGSDTFQQGWTVFPNPFVTELTIQSSFTMETEIEILDATGKSLRTFLWKGDNPIPVEDLQAGTYLLLIRTGKQALHFRVVKVP